MADEITVVIGTAADCDIRVTDDVYVSNRHARVRRDQAGLYWIEDLGSMNGTWIGHARVYGPTLLRPGDTIRIGRTTIPWTGGAA